MAATLAMKIPYPDKNVVKTLALAKIFHGQIANARNSTMYWPRGILMYLGNSSELSAPKGIMFAAMLVPKMDMDQHAAAKKTAKRLAGVQYRSRIAERRSHGFQSDNPHVLLMAAVAKIPKVAARVTIIGCTINWDI